jgi:16S rRNA (guanine527-N7)-methyltransferase
VTPTSEAEQLRQWSARIGIPIDVATIERLGRFLDLLEVWNRRFHLTGDRDRAVLVGKHQLDCLAVVQELPRAGLVVDIGTGAGFPGLVLGCARPDLPLCLIEPRRRPVSFLSEAISSISLPLARVVEDRAERAAAEPALSGAASLLVSRALRLDVLLDLAAPFLAKNGEIVAMQTPSLREDVAADLAKAKGLALIRHRDYRLPGGEERRLLIFGPA